MWCVCARPTRVCVCTESTHSVLCGPLCTIGHNAVVLSQHTMAIIKRDTHELTYTCASHMCAMCACDSCGICAPGTGYCGRGLFLWDNGALNGAWPSPRHVCRCRAGPAGSPLRGELGRINTAVVASERARRGEPVSDQSKGVRRPYGRLAAPQSASGRNNGCAARRLKACRQPAMCTDHAQAGGACP